VEETFIYDNGKGADDILKDAVPEILDFGVDSIVLGCTHFLHLTSIIEKICGSKIKLIDSREGVGKRILSLVEASKNRKVENVNLKMGIFIFPVDVLIILVSKIYGLFFKV